MNTFKDKSIRWPDKSAIKFTSAFQMQNQAQRKSWIIWSADFSLWTFHKTHLTDNTDEVLILQNMEVSIEGSPVHSANAQNVIEPSKIFLHFHSFFFFFSLGVAVALLTLLVEQELCCPPWHTVAGVNCQLFSFALMWRAQCPDRSPWD